MGGGLGGAGASVSMSLWLPPGVALPLASLDALSAGEALRVTRGLSLAVTAGVAVPAAGEGDACAVKEPGKGVGVPSGDPVAAPGEGVPGGDVESAALCEGASVAVVLGDPVADAVARGEPLLTAVPSLLGDGAPLAVPRAVPEGRSEAPGEKEAASDGERGAVAEERALSDAEYVARGLPVGGAVAASVAEPGGVAEALAAGCALAGPLLDGVAGALREREPGGDAAASATSTSPSRPSATSSCARRRAWRRCATHTFF
jgi:hypothetical protein